MSSRRVAATAMLVAATAVLLGCGGGESVGDVLERNEDTGDEESASGSSTTGGTSVAAEDVVVRVPPSGHRFDLGAPLATAGEVEDPDHYRQTTTIDSLVSEVIDDVVLRSVLVLPAEHTLEGCPQVRLVYADDADVDNLVVFLLPQTCALAYDDTPYDQTYGGLPSRFDGYEVLVGTTVVQLDGTLRAPEFEVVAESLQPTTVEALVAAVVPLPD
jgi:hypothetical protein